MGNIQLVVLNLVVWTPVLAFSEFVVTAAILVAMPPDCGRYGGSVAEVVIVSIS